MTVGDILSLVTPEVSLCHQDQVTHKKWQSALYWLNSLVLNPPASMPVHGIDLADECCREILSIPFDQKIPSVTRQFDLKTSDLPTLLGDDHSNWLNDDLINAGAEFIT